MADDYGAGSSARERGKQGPGGNRKMVRQFAPMKGWITLCVAFIVVIAGIWGLTR